MKINKWLTVGGLALVLGFCGTEVMAQGGGGGGRGNRGGGNMDPAQWQQRMMDRYKEQLEIKDDTEWKAIQPLVQKVGDARMALMRGSFGGGRRGGPGGGDAGGDRARSGNPEVEALQKAIDAKATNAELKAAIEKVTEARKTKQADLEKAQAELRKVLTVRQEALATLNGIL